MNLIVVVYSDWGIGKDGTQPIALSADRKFFRQTTRGAMVIAGRRTVEDFPNRQPLPGRVNVVLSRTLKEMPGFMVCSTPEEALELAKGQDSVFVIGGGSVYRALLPYCCRAYVTKLSCCPESDTYFPNLDESSDWQWERLQSGEEAGVAYEMRLYTRVQSQET